MGRRRQALACGLSAVALGLPSSAWAQGAGDEQYTDPFEDEQDQGGGSQPNQGAQEPEQTPVPAEPDTPTSSQEPAAPAAPPAEAPAAESAQLPRTGTADAGLLALGGTLLLASGVALRVRLSEPAPRRR